LPFLLIAGDRGEKFPVMFFENTARRVRGGAARFFFRDKPGGTNVPFEELKNKPNLTTLNQAMS